MKARVGVSPLLADPDALHPTDRPVAEGASALVFRVNSAGGALALKVAKLPEHDRRLATEAKQLLLSRCSALPRLVDVGRVPTDRAGLSAGRAFIALEWCAGRTLPLKDAKAAERTLAALVIARDVGSALADLHGLGLCHGDVKPDNILYNPDGASPRATLIDLGLAAPLDVVVPSGATPRYLAPETALGQSDGRARDLYALGLSLAEIVDPKLARVAKLTSEHLRDVPAELRDIIRALLAKAPKARPSADWIARKATQRVGASALHDPMQAVVGAYLATRRRSIWEAARHEVAAIETDGEPGVWLRDAVQLGQRITRVCGKLLEQSAPPLSELDPLGRRRFLMALAGPQAVNWPATEWQSDGALCQQLQKCLESTHPHALTFSDLSRGLPAARRAVKDPVALALLIGAGVAGSADLDAAEDVVFEDGKSTALALALSRALRLRGELGRSIAVLEGVHSESAQLERAETLRRAGDWDAAESCLDEAARRGGDRDATESSPKGTQQSPLRSEQERTAAAIRARILLDRGRPDEAGQVLLEHAASEESCEVRALLSLRAGRLAEARREALTGLASAKTAETLARLSAVLGYVSHAEGRPATAMDHFARSAEHAARAGAVLEEATYLTGLSAAAADTGHASRALDAAERGALLFEALGRTAQAARAHLARASILATLGAETEAREAAAEALSRARDAGDDLCRAYVHLCLADLSVGSADEAEHAERAATILREPTPDDALRVASRKWRAGILSDDALAALDQSARLPERALDARLDWWGARAAVEGSRAEPQRADVIFAEMSTLVATPAPLAALGCASAYAARLAARLSDGDHTRRFVHAARTALEALKKNAPADLALRVEAAPWWQVVPPAPGAALVPEQIADVENLVRALAGRERLRPLLDQVLDALVLWTGVERGLLLLKAPGGRLVPRAARNLARKDLVGEQLSLSTSLSERALEQGEPVVAVDAAGELSVVHQSVHALKLRSVLAVPLIARGEALGVVYLDDRVRRGAFGARELGWVRLVATLAAIAIADARDQLLLRRAARRARRAEEKLAARLARREVELDLAQRELSSHRQGAHASIIGESVALQKLLGLMKRIARSDVPVLVIGESGSGKELVARAIHDDSSRRDKPFVSENCGAIPEPLLEATLFGHVKGAFTGAVRGRAGLFEVANGGTLFLDEIGEMSAAMQTKLLRVFESGEVRPVGSESMRKVDVRVIGATHRDLKELVADGSFREDLLFRLDVVSLRVPPLRERPDDIPRLAQHFLRKHAEGREVTLSPQASDVLSAFSWPGNVRQLENEMRRALVFCDDAVLPEHLSEEVRSSDARGAASHFDLKARVDELTRKLVLEALQETSDNQTKAAELLGISRFGLSKMLRRLELDAAPQTLPEPGPRVSRVPRRHARPDAPSRAKRSKPARRDG